MTVRTKLISKVLLFPFITFVLGILLFNREITANALPKEEKEIDWVMLLPEDKGKDLVVSSCATCHGLDIIVTRKQSKDAWLNTVGLMSGDYAAQIPEADADGIAEYLGRYAGENNPITKVPMNVNTASSDAFKRLRFLNDENIAEILKYRSGNKFRDLKELQQLLKLDQEKIDLATVYLEVK